MFYNNFFGFSGVPSKIKTVVLPSTADDINQQYVCLTLEVHLVKDYPDSEPIIKLLNPRGLDDLLFNDIQNAVKQKCEECIGSPVVFELIEVSNYIFFKTFTLLFWKW